MAKVYHGRARIYPPEQTTTINFITSVATKATVERKAAERGQRPSQFLRELLEEVLNKM